MHCKKNAKNGDNDNDQNNASMAHMSKNDKIPSRDFSDSLKLNNWILESGATCHMTPQVSYLSQVH